MAAKAIRFCFRTVCTKPLSVRVSSDETAASAEDGVGRRPSREAMLDGNTVERHRVLLGHFTGGRRTGSRRESSGLVMGFASGSGQNSGAAPTAQAGEA